MALSSALLLTTAGSLASAPVAVAATYVCDTPANNYFDGYVHDAAAHGDNFEGTSGFITSTDALTCSTDTSGPDPMTNTIGNNFTTSWVMIADYDLNAWSQVGVIAGYYQSVYNWAEVVVKSGPYKRRFDRFAPGGAVPTGTKQAFYEQFLYNCAAPTNHACEESKVGNIRITDTNFDPFVVFHSGGYSPPRWAPQYVSEKTYQANDIMGTPLHHLKFESIGVQQYSNDQFVLEPCTLTFLNTATRATHSAAGCTAFDTWTTVP